MKKAIVIRTDGSKEIVEFDDTTAYDVIKDGVGGWIEHVGLPDEGLSMYVNEEGKLEGLPINLLATDLFADQYPYLDDVIVGNAVFVGEPDDEGNDEGLTDLQVQLLMSM